MRSGDVIRIARERAGLTQQQLAVRSGRPRETIARWENGAQEPSLSALQDVVAAAGLELTIRMSEGDGSLRERVMEQLERKPRGRLEALLPKELSRDALRALAWLATATTPSIVVGVVAGALLGAPERPGDGHVEFVADDPSAAEDELRAAGFTPLDVEARWRERDIRAPWLLPKGGTLELASHLPGTDDFRDLRRSAVGVELGRGRNVLVAHPRDLLRMAEASASTAAHARAPGLRALLTELD